MGIPKFVSINFLGADGVLKINHGALLREASKTRPT
jgi:hypothetical protein